MALSALISILFYRSYYGLLMFIPIHYVNLKRSRRKKTDKDREKFLKEYKEYLLCINNSLQAGHAIESAFSEAEEEVRMICGEDTVFCREIREMNRKVGLSVPIEKAFAEFAERYPLEEVRTFSEVFIFAKRLGGNYVENIRRTALKLEEKISLKQDILSMTAEKRLEMNVMSVMPLLILCYISVSSGEFLAPLYHNTTGIAVMTGCLIVYAVMIFIGQRIVRIEI